MVIWGATWELLWPLDRGLWSHSRRNRKSIRRVLLGVDDAMPLCMWARHFFLHQGLKLKHTAPSKRLGKRNIVLQDNASSIQLEKNGKRSSGKQTRHIAIRYFYVTSKVRNGEISITYCPTKEIVSDFLTKPLQGSLFRIHWNSIMWVSTGISFGTRKQNEHPKVNPNLFLFCILGDVIST